MEEGMNQPYEGRVKGWLFFSFGTTENGRNGRTWGSEMLIGCF